MSTSSRIHYVGVEHKFFGSFFGFLLKMSPLRFFSFFNLKVYRVQVKVLFRQKKISCQKSFSDNAELVHVKSENIKSSYSMCVGK